MSKNYSKSKDQVRENLMPRENSTPIKISKNKYNSRKTVERDSELAYGIPNSST